MKAKGGFSTHVELRPAMLKHPADIEISLKDGKVQIGRAHAVYGVPKRVASWLRSVHADGLSERISGEDRSPVGILEYVEVDQDYRGQGLGRRLVEELLGVLDQKGVQVVYLQASADVGGIPERALVRLYEGFGFKEIGRTGDHADDPVMILEL